MSRPLIESTHFSHFEETAFSTGTLAGTRSRILSRDDEDGAYTALVRAGAGTVLRPEQGRSLEVYLLSGLARLGDEVLHPGFYGYVTPTESHRLTIDEDAAVFFATGELGTGSGPTVVVDPDTLPWNIRVRDGVEPSTTGTSTNIVKFLRVDEKDGSGATVGAMWPGSGLDCAERHITVDEGLTLRGDMLLLGPDGAPVEVRPGCYMWRPGNARHLPKYSHHGSFGFSRTREAGWNVVVEFEAEPRWPAMLESYKAKLGATDVVF